MAWCHSLPRCLYLDPVICARGSIARNHQGNRRYRAIVIQSLDRYSQATSKIEKSIIVSEIVEKVRGSSPNGGFVKNVDGFWYEVGDHLAREKVGQSIRDSLHDQYRSSTKAKKHRREVKSASRLSGNVDDMMSSNRLVSNRLGKLSQDMQFQREDASELFVTQLLTQANFDLLEAFKKDDALLTRFIEASHEYSDNALSEPILKAI
jgi:hypothetical protein